MWAREFMCLCVVTVAPHSHRSVSLSLAHLLAYIGAPSLFSSRIVLVSLPLRVISLFLSFVCISCRKLTHTRTPHTHNTHTHTRSLYLHHRACVSRSLCVCACVCSPFSLCVYVLSLSEASRRMIRKTHQRKTRRCDDTAPFDVQAVIMTERADAMMWLVGIKGEGNAECAHTHTTHTTHTTHAHMHTHTPAHAQMDAFFVFLLFLLSSFHHHNDGVFMLEQTPVYACV